MPSPRLAIYLLSAAIATTLAPLSATAQSDDFDDGNDAGWTRFDPLGSTTFSFPAGGYRISSPASPDPVNFGPARAASLRQDFVYADFCVTVDLVAFDDSLTQAAGVIARVQPGPGAGNIQAYTFTYQPLVNDVIINRVTGEVPTGISDDVELPITPTTLRLVFFGRGDYLEGRVYDTADLVNPLVTVFAYDATYSTGTCGLLVSDFSAAGTGGTNATFDDYHADAAVAPLLTVTTDPSDNPILTWPDTTGCWDLETSTTLEAGSWSEVTSGISHDAGAQQFVFPMQPQTNGPERFWRLVVPDGP